MRAAICKTLGKPEDLVIGEIDAPEIRPNHVRIAVHAGGINFADTLMIAGKYQEKPELPFVPGSEGAGEIIEVGEGVSEKMLGQRVMFLGMGSFGEEAVVPAAATVPIPPKMDYATAASFVITYGTSHVALNHRAKLQPGETLLVHGAAGGVGLAAVEIGKRMGATVIGTASTAEKLALAKKHGADHVINYKEGEFRHKVKELTGGKGADVIYDPVGGDTFDQSLRCINWEGRILVVGFASGRIPQAPANICLVKNCSVVGVYWGAYMQKNPKVITDSLATLLGWWNEGALEVVIGRKYPLDQIADAMNSLINRESKSKVVIEVR